MPVGRPFPPGTSGNPAGRPSTGESLSEITLKYLNEIANDPTVPEDKRHLRFKELFVQAVVRRAIDGDPTAMRLVYAYADGLPLQRIDVTSTPKRDDWPEDPEEAALFTENLERVFPHLLASPPAKDDE